MAAEAPLKMTFDPQTVEHLGVKMYSNIPNAIAELIANAYDADAKEVTIKLIDDGKQKSIEVSDNGDGMTFEEINKKFLRIGRNRRKDGSKETSSGRKATGKKGLGKLALFGIGDVIEIKTTIEGSDEGVLFTLDWNKLKSEKDGDYLPGYEFYKCEKSSKGTAITLKELKRKSDFNDNDLAKSLSKLFNFFDATFKCSVQLNDNTPIQVDAQLRYKEIEEQKEFIWELPNFTASLESDYDDKGKIKGKIISTKKPLKPGLRGITLFANGRLVNEAEFFGTPESSHGFSYFTGWLNVDFVDEIENDIISTSRQSLNWDAPEIDGLRDFLAATLKSVEKDWRAKRKEKKRNNIKDKTKIDVPKWFSTLPPEILEQIEPLVNSISDEAELDDEEAAKFVEQVHKLIPEYPYYHWRHLDEEVQKVSEKYYENQDYYTAFHEVVKRYINDVKNISGSQNGSPYSMMGEVFGMDNAGNFKKLSVTTGYKRPNQTDFDPQTIRNIEKGQQSLSEGVVEGCRNVIAHEEHTDLRDSDLFSEKDCLDALSLLSHLFRRLNNSTKL